jgi:Flp pilus assembly protein TadD
VNVLFHAANAVLLFLVLNKMSGATWRSAAVAALFAWHPLRVESVAWISERKDVLCGFFFMLTLWAYARYAQKRSRVEGRGSSAGDDGLALDSRRWTLDYSLALIFFALGLMSKPMLVTVPLILLLLDFWPLRRVTSDEWRVTRFGLPVPQPSTFNHLLFEKLPFLALSLASSIATFWAQSEGGAVVSLMKIPWYGRALDALVFYTAYLEKMFWPVNLSVLYQYQRMEPWEFIRGALLPVLLCLLFIRLRRSQPHLFTGWFWFLVMLVPVIGLVQVGGQSIADRYTYLPSIGLFILVAWAAGKLALRSRLWRTGMTLGLAAVLAACLTDTRFQLGYWRNDITLFRHAVEVTRGSYCYFSLANAYLNAGNLEDAAENYRIALQIYPDFPKAHYYFGTVLLRQKKYAEAQEEFGEVLRTNPEIAFAHKYLGDALAAQGKYAEAVAEYTTTLQLKLDDRAIRTALALATQNADGVQAVKQAERACELTQYGVTPIVGTLAAAYAEAGRFDAAIATAEKACAQAKQSGEQGLMQKNQELLELYRAHRPYHEPFEKLVPAAP